MRDDGRDRPIWRWGIEALEKAGILKDPGSFEPGRTVIAGPLYPGSASIIYRERTTYEDGSVHEQWFRDPDLEEPMGVEVRASRVDHRDGSSDMTYDCFTEAGELNYAILINRDGSAVIDFHSSLGGVETNTQLWSQDLDAPVPGWRYETRAPDWGEKGSIWHNAGQIIVTPDMDDMQPPEHRSGGHGGGPDGDD